MLGWIMRAPSHVTLVGTYRQGNERSRGEGRGRGLLLGRRGRGRRGRRSLRVERVVFARAGDRLRDRDAQERDVEVGHGYIGQGRGSFGEGDVDGKQKSRYDVVIVLRCWSSQSRKREGDGPRDGSSLPSSSGDAAPHGYIQNPMGDQQIPTLATSRPRRKRGIGARQTQDPSTRMSSTETTSRSRPSPPLSHTPSVLLAPLSPVSPVTTRGRSSPG